MNHFTKATHPCFICGHRVDISSLSQVSSSLPSTEERLWKISGLLQHSFTPVLLQHYSVISILSALLVQGSGSGGGADILLRLIL